MFNFNNFFLRVFRPTSLFLINRLRFIKWNELASFITMASTAAAVNRISSTASTTASTASSISRNSTPAFLIFRAFGILFRTTRSSIVNFGILNTISVLLAMRQVIRQVILSNLPVRGVSTLATLLLAVNNNLNGPTLRFFSDHFNSYFKDCLVMPKKLNFIINLIIFLSSIGTFNYIFKYSFKFPFFIFRFVIGLFTLTLGINWSDYLQSFDYLKEFAVLSKDYFHNLFSINIPDNKPNLEVKDSYLNLSSINKWFNDNTPESINWYSVGGVILLGFIGLMFSVYAAETIQPGISNNLPHGDTISNIVNSINISFTNAYSSVSSLANNTWNWISSFTPWGDNNLQAHQNPNPNNIQANLDAPQHNIIRNTGSITPPDTISRSSSGSSTASANSNTTISSNSPLPIRPR